MSILKMNADCEHAVGPERFACTIVHIYQKHREWETYLIFRREMQPIKQWKQKQEYMIFICGSSYV